MMYKISASTLIFLFGLLITVFIYEYFPIEVIRARVQPYKILTPIVRPGEQITYLVDACKLFRVTSTVYRTFVDGSRYPTITSSNNLPATCGKTKISTLVPLYIPSGKYHLELDLMYHVLPFKNVYYHFKTEDFKVATDSSQLK